MKHRTADLSGALLDAAVAKAMQLRGVEIISDGRFDPWVKVRESPREGLGLVDVPGGWMFSPSKLWQCGGPIIERERITVQASRAGDWRAWVGDGDSQPAPEGRGDGALIAAMRAYVASRLGDEVDL